MGEYFDIDMRECKLTKGTENEKGEFPNPHFVLDPSMIKELVDENTIGVVVTLGELIAP